jgi:hypothetical protein
MLLFYYYYDFNACTSRKTNAEKQGLRRAFTPVLRGNQVMCMYPLTPVLVVSYKKLQKPGDTEFRFITHH